MAGALLDHAPAVRVAVFVGVLALVSAWEAARPRRARTDRWSRRLLANLGLVAIATALVRLLPILPPLAMAELAGARGWGLLGGGRAGPLLEVSAAIALLDLGIWVQHVAFHRLPMLWRMHRVHHSDLDFDATTAVRFHPLEIVLSQVWKLVLIAALGAPPLAVLGFEVLLNGLALFNHANASLPPWLESPLRRLVVTPDMHRVHHSTERAECDSNFGFCLSWWDHLFGTWRAAPAAGHAAMRIGLAGERDGARLGLPRLLAMPFCPGAAAPPVASGATGAPPA